MAKRPRSSRSDPGYRSRRPLLERLPVLPGRRKRLPYYTEDDAEPEVRRPLWKRVLLTPWELTAGAFRGVGRAAGATFHAARTGWKSRQAKYLLQGLPALAAAAALVTFLVATGLQARTLDARYRSAATDAFSAGDYGAANLYYRRLGELDDGSPATRFQLAMTFDALGADDKASEIITGLLGSRDGAGHPRAHRWVAHKILTDEQARQDPRRVGEAHRHLLRARRAAPDDPDVALQLAQYYVAVGDMRTALPLLEEVVEVRPGLAFDLARVYAELGDERSADRATRIAEEHYRRQVQRDVTDHQARTIWAGSLVNLGRFDEAVAALQKGMEFDPQRFAPVLSNTMVVEYDRMLRENDRRPGRRLALLRQALKFQANNSLALVRLINFADGDGTPGDAGESKALLEQILAAGEVPPAAHLALGVRSWQDEDWDTARWHLERAFELDDSLGVVTNNLAWVLAFQEQPEPDRALRLIDSVIERWPDVPTYRDTRGEILHQVGRDGEALPELERALGGGLKDARLHLTLAEIYDGLGRTGLAARHREQAESLAPVAAADAP